MQKQAVIYTRISKDLEGLGLGVARQLNDCRDYASKNGYQVVEELEDNDISASGLAKRPSYLKLRELLATRAIDVVLVYALDRLHRNVRELVEYMELSQETNTAIESVVAGKVDLASADGRMVATILGAFGAAEREKTSERLLRKARANAEEGRWPGRRVYGYRADATIVPEEAGVIREIAQRILGGEGLNAVASSLNARGVPTLNGAAWRAATIVGIARSARIAGHREHHGVITKRDAWDRIVDDEDSILLRDMLAKGRSKGRPVGGPRKHLLTGLLVCGNCGAPMQRGLAGAQRVPNYRCAKNEGSQSCGRISISLRSTEEFVAAALFAAFDRPSQDEDDPGEAERTHYVAESKRLEERKIKLAIMYGEGTIDVEEWMAASKSIKEQLQALPSPRAKAKRRRATGSELAAAWPTMETSTRRALLDQVFVKITVMPRRIVTGAKVWDSGRLVPEWRV
ncbi:recombinase family protein [Arthrobacter sp. N1]|uniref:recombinase family protein n=1 Tax=Arthrobacter sp. N1 TaxID=619291 RepID=UPI003BAE86DD